MYDDRAPSTNPAVRALRDVMDRLPGARPRASSDELLLSVFEDEPEEAFAYPTEVIYRDGHPARIGAWAPPTPPDEVRRLRARAEKARMRWSMRRR